MTNVYVAKVSYDENSWDEPMTSSTLPLYWETDDGKSFRSTITDLMKLGIKVDEFTVQYPKETITYWRVKLKVDS